MLILHSDPFLKMASASKTSKNNTTAKARESKFTISEKRDLVDIICNEDQMNGEGEPEEPMIVKLRSKSIANKEKAALYKRVSEELVERGYKARSQKGIKRMWNLLILFQAKAKELLMQ